jgi:hypothetical protein
MSIFAKAAAFARSPQGRRLMRQASTYAKSPEGRQKIQQAVQTAKSRRAAAPKKRVR